MTTPTTLAHLRYSCPVSRWLADRTIRCRSMNALPDTMKRAMARQAEAEREKRAKIIAAEGESLAAAPLGDTSDTTLAHPLALQLRNLQTLLELGIDKNTTAVFPAPLMSTIAELGALLARESGAAVAPEPIPPIAIPALSANGTAAAGSRR